MGAAGIQRPDDIARALQEALAGRYVIKRPLGKGGMGIVYLALETALERMVALKILPPAIASPRRRERFLREAKTAARLEHPNVVPMYAVDEAGPFVYYTMQYIEGETVAQRIMIDGPLPAGEATRILRDVARAVHYAHEQGVVHRDLKPQNILIERQSGRVYVADFGLAQVVGDGLLPDGGPGGTFGSYLYVSPQQAAGLPVDRRSDVYSLGVVGYVMATGKAPFQGTVREVLEQHLTRQAPPLKVFNRHLDVTLSRAVARCLAKDAGERFPSADELARALSEAPELRSDLPGPLRAFVNRLERESSMVPGAVLLGLFALAWLASAAQAGDWGKAAGLLASVGVLLAAPVLGALPATRRLLRQGYARADIVHALHMDLDRQREQRAASWGRAMDTTATVTRRIVKVALGLFAFGGLAAVSGVDLPLRLVLGSMVVGALTMLFGGLLLAGLESRRAELSGHRWLGFWGSRLGGWTVKLAGMGLKRLPQGPEPGALPFPAEAQLPAPSELDQIWDVASRSESCIRRSRARLAAASASRERDGRTPTPEETDFEQRLEQRLAVLEALLDKFKAVETDSLEPGSLTVDLEAAEALYQAVDALIAERELPL
ncbi:MAG TPA: serine/threonine-protein kinase [Gemmatimonadales bacterium]|nr:serine/threonine-protein kinase [Gemmatimonadales bacterium]